MRATNVLFIMSDQQQGRALGCAGHEFVQTPNLDKLAAGGTRFANAYTNSAICVPARAVLATGQHVFKTQYWCNAHPYDGAVESWHHVLAKQGRPVTSIGKLHFRNETDPTGFAEQIIPMHVVQGQGDLRSCIKRPMTPPMQGSRTVTNIGRGTSSYTDYDRDIADRTCAWLEAHAGGSVKQPFSLFVSFVCPHPPYIAPPEFYDLYPEASMPTPKLSSPDAPTHPWIQAMQNNRNYNDFVTEKSRRVIASSYHGCISYLDFNVGRVLDALEKSGMRDSTLVVFTSDHGDNLGARRLYGKSNMYQEASHIPMIVAGPGVAEGHVSHTPVSLLDIAPTMLDAAEHDDQSLLAALPGESLISLSKTSDNAQRVVFCEYYAAAADRAAFMLRQGRYKYIHYVGYEPELFDLTSDPEELHSLADDKAYATVVAGYAARLRTIVDPELADDAAYRAQTALVDANGGRDTLIARGKYNGTPAPGQPLLYDQ